MAKPSGIFTRFPPILFVVGLVALVAVIAMVTIGGGSLSLGGASNTAGSAVETTDARARVEVVTCVFNGTPYTSSCESRYGSCIGFPTCDVTVSAKPKTRITWSSPQCAGNPVTTMDGRPETIVFQCAPPPQVVVEEDVICYFNGSAKNEYCIASEIVANCSGIGKCGAHARGLLNQKVTWTSSCGGTATTILDGAQEGIVFQCRPQDTKEAITCIFNGSTSGQMCYSSSGVNCNGTTSCVTGVYGYVGEKINWKSTCGGYQTTTMDGVGERILFNCAPSCQNECGQGALACLNSSHVQQCGNYDNDPCTEWGFKQICGAGTTCTNGLCVGPSSCYDSDGGIQVSTPGYVTAFNGTTNMKFDDECLAPYLLREYFCDGSEPTFYDATCPSCVSGACVNGTGNST